MRTREVWVSRPILGPKLGADTRIGPEHSAGSGPDPGWEPELAFKGEWGGGAGEQKKTPYL